MAPALGFRTATAVRGWPVAGGDCTHLPCSPDGLEGCPDPCACGSRSQTTWGGDFSLFGLTWDVRKGARTGDRALGWHRSLLLSVLGGLSGDPDVHKTRRLEQTVPSNATQDHRPPAGSWDRPPHPLLPQRLRTTPGLAALAHRPRPRSSAAGHSDATRLPEGSAVPTPGIFWVVFLLLGYFLFLGKPCSCCEQRFPLPWAKGAASGHSFSWTSLQTLEGQEQLKVGGDPSCLSRGRSRLRQEGRRAPLLGRHSSCQEPGLEPRSPRYGACLCSNNLTHHLTLTIAFGTRTVPLLENRCKSETENSLAQKSSLEKPWSASLEKPGYKAISSSAYTTARSWGAGKKSCFLNYQEGCGIKPDTSFLIVLQLAHFLSVPCQERIWPFHKVGVCKAIRNTGVLDDQVNLNLWDAGISVVLWWLEAACGPPPFGGEFTHLDSRRGVLIVSDRMVSIIPNPTDAFFNMSEPLLLTWWKDENQRLKGTRRNSLLGDDGGRQQEVAPSMATSPVCQPPHPKGSARSRTRQGCLCLLMPQHIRL